LNFLKEEWNFYPDKEKLKAIKSREKMLKQTRLKSKRAEHFCRPFVLTNPLNSIAKLEIYPTIKNYFLPMLISF